MSYQEEEVATWLYDNQDFLISFLANAPPSFVDGLGQGKYHKEEKSFSSLAQNLLKSIGTGDKPADQNIDYEELVQKDEDEVFTRLVSDIAGEMDVDKLCHRILKNVNILTKSDRGSLFLTQGDMDSKFLVSKLFDVTKTSTLKETLHTTDTEIMIPFGTGIAGHVALTKEEINIKDAYIDPRFNQAVDKKTGYRTHSILCLPILDNEGEVIGVAQIINKRTQDHIFNEDDIKIFRTYLTFCGIGLEKAQLFEMSVREYQRTQLLLKLERDIFEDQSDLPRVMKKTLFDAQQMLCCESCSVYLIDNCDEDIDFDTSEKNYGSPDEVTFSNVYQLCASGSGEISILKESHIKPPVLTTISRCVVAHRETINIQDLTNDLRFTDEYCSDEQGLMIRSILSMPLFNNKNHVIGVTQFINKRNGFVKVDEEVIEAFSVFLAIGVHNCLMYQHVFKMLAKHKVAMDVLSFHATTSSDEVDKLCNMDLSVTKPWGIASYEFDDYALDDMDTCKLVVKIILDTGADEKFHIPYDVLCRWCLSVRKNYRPVIYHNWRHAVNVFQSMYAILYTGKLKSKFSDIEIFALLAACLCHDLDHRGTNNAFQAKADSPLATLYSTSIMENHHFDQCIMILNSDGNNIFMSLDAEDYRQVLHLLEHYILSTDLAVYFQKRGELSRLVDAGVDFRDDKHRSVLSSLMMTICDLSAISKPWTIQYRTAQLVSAEFFQQGDLERDFLGESPMPMMDRDLKSELPKMQVNFIDAVCMPVFSLFSRLDPALAPMHIALLNNKKHWQELQNRSKPKSHH